MAESHCLVIMNEEMPGVGGKELLEALRGVTEGPIVVVGNGGETAWWEHCCRVRTHIWRSQ
jgi:hypothetical protein